MSQTLLPDQTKNDQEVADAVDDALAIREPQTETSVAADSKKPRRLRRWLIRIAVAALVIVLIAAIVIKVSFDRVEAQASLVNQTGVSLNKFFKEFSSSLANKDLNAAARCFTSDNRLSKEFRLDLDLTQDGVDAFCWTEEANEPKADRAASTLRKQLSFFVAPFAEIQLAKTKIMSMRELDEHSATVKALVWLRGTTDELKKVESKSEFEFELLKDSAGQWRIADNKLLFGRTVIGKGYGFVDITKSAGIRFESTHNPMLELPEWFPKTFGIMKYASAGVAVADYDSDGNQDIFFCDGTNPTLYRGNGDGTFEDAMDESGLPRNIYAVHVAIFFDADNDGDQDLLLGRSTGDNLFFRNEGSGRYVDITSTANISGVWVSTAAAFDYDNDGFVDLLLGRYLDPRTSLPDTNFFTRNGCGASLLRNNGDLTFSDVTSEAGINETGLNLGISCADWDLDGDQDVYIANDFGRNAMLQNNGDGTFSDVSQETKTEDIGYGMSACFEDINADGRLDLYVASVHSGQRWFGNSATLQRYLFTSVQEGTIVEDYPLYREIYTYLDGDWADFGEKVIRGNSLMINQGDGTFENVTEHCRTNPHGWYWSSAVFDFDNSGQNDIYSVNGWITGHTTDDL